VINMLSNKVALVTGASSGIGRAVALAYARDGAKVVVSDMNIDGGEETVAMVRKQGGDAIFVVADVGKPADSQALVERTVAHFGRLDIACNNAGIGGPSAPIADYPLDGWAHVININLSGVFYGMQQQIAAMLKTGGGSIVNMASVLGAVGFATNSAYTAAKHGVVVSLKWPRWSTAARVCA
jgi:NAD(P)-dependent dehydrogenase (short-subunit alcohol dehydrogenase family)